MLVLFLLLLGCTFQQTVLAYDCLPEEQGPKIVGTGYVGSAHQGTAEALSSDGNTLAVGGFGDNNFNGATWIFTRTEGGWYQQGNKLVGTAATGTGGAYQGWSVALSSDGNTLAVGGPYDNNGVGAAWVFIRTNGAWRQQATKIVGTGYAQYVSNQGSGVSLTSDGNTLAVGGFGDNGNVGATWIFARANAHWTQQGTKLVGYGNIGPSFQGWSVSFSANGNTLAVGGARNNYTVGATWVFTKTSEGTWNPLTSILLGDDYVGTAYQGASVSLSSDGNTLAVGGYGDSGFTGAAWIYTRSTDGVWSQQGPKLVGYDFTGTSYQGFGVALSGSGTVLAIGGYQDNDNVGAAWIFTQSYGLYWDQQGTKIIGTNLPAVPAQGWSVALSSTGNTLAVGAYGDDGDIGATRVFDLTNVIYPCTK